MKIINTIVVGPSSSRTNWHLMGNALIESLPAKLAIFVFNRNTMTLLASVTSCVDGTWKIIGMPEYPAESLLVMATSGSRQNAEVFDYVSQTTD